MVTTAVVAGVVVFGLFSLTARSAVRVVPEGEMLALTVFGRVEGVLTPGLNIVPPFVSRTHPLDPASMTMERDGEAVPVPAEFEDDVRAAATEGVSRQDDRET